MRHCGQTKQPSQRHRGNGYAVARCLAAMAMAALVTSCAGKTSTIEIIDLGVSGPAGHYREVFEEAYFDIDARGHIDIVLRRQEPSPATGGLDLTQIVHIHGIWRSIPGQTVADGTQINSCVTYAILDGDLGSSFDGSGALFLDGKETGDEISGKLEHAMLKPRRQLVAHRSLFERADLSGSFHAQRDRQRTRQLINELHRRFGPVGNAAK